MREIILNSIFNQVTYPNSTTFFYLNFLLMQLSQNENTQTIEQIQTIMCERVLAEMPIPWGISYLYCEYMRNSDYEND